MIDSTADSIQGFSLHSAPVHGTVVRMTQSLQTVLAQHHYPLVVQHTLTEALIANLLVASTLKWQGKLIMQYQNNGSLSLLVTQSTHQRHVTGMAKWHDPLPASSDALMNQGHLITSVLHDRRVEPDQSIVPLNQAGLTESLQDYFSRSVQLPTKLWISGTDQAAYGVLLQALPSPGTAFNFDSFIAGLDENALDFTHTNSSLLTNLLLDHECTLYEAESVHFGCSCSLTKMQQAIVAMGETEARLALQATPTLVVQCDFCNDQYSFTADDIDRLFQSPR